LRSWRLCVRLSFHAERGSRKGTKFAKNGGNRPNSFSTLRDFWRWFLWRPWRHGGLSRCRSLYGIRGPGCSRIEQRMGLEGVLYSNTQASVLQSNTSF
jgi:hypothetical protein